MHWSVDWTFTTEEIRQERSPTPSKRGRTSSISDPSRREGMNRAQRGSERDGGDEESSSNGALEETRSISVGVVLCPPGAVCPGGSRGERGLVEAGGGRRRGGEVRCRSKVGHWGPRLKLARHCGRQRRRGEKESESGRGRRREKATRRTSTWLAAPVSCSPSSFLPLSSFQE